MFSKIDQSNSTVNGYQAGRDNNIININILNNSENINKFTDNFNNFLEKTELHFISSYKECNFNDLYIPIDLNNENMERINIEDLYLDFIKHPRNLIISGNEISGKTSSLKYLIQNLNNDFTVIYEDATNNIQLPIKNFLLNKKKTIYKNDSDIDSYILFIDNFHKLHNDRLNKILKSAKEIEKLYFIVTVDNVFIDNIRSKDLMKDFKVYKIKSLGAFLIDKLVENWLKLNNTNDSILFKEKDKYINKLNSVILNSIIPKYPFYIYTILSELQHSYRDGINQAMTSHVYCYQTLIYLSLYKVNVNNDSIGLYYTVLTELSYYFYTYYQNNKSYEIHKDDITDFLKKEYEYKINENIDKILDKLDRAKLLTISGCGYYKFEYQYIYYFYLGKYFADNIDEKNNRKILYNMIDNLDKLENAYIIIFLIHHTKDKDILNHLQIRIMCYYDKNKELTLNSSDIEWIENRNEIIFSFVFDKEIDPNENRKKLLIEQDKIEEENNMKENDYNDIDLSLLEMRKALKSIEVMGHILNSRYDSIKSKELDEYLEFTMSLLFRIGGKLFNDLKECRDIFIDYFYNEIKDECDDYDREKITILIKKMLFNYTLFVIIGTIKSCSQIILSNKFISFIEEFNENDSKRTPLTVLIEKDVKMMYDKSVNFQKLESYLKDENINDLLKNIYKFLVRDYLYYNPVSEKDKQKIFSICNFKEIKK